MRTQQTEQAQPPMEEPPRGGARQWSVELDDGRQVPWVGLHTGPRTLSCNEVEAICQRLLGFGTAALAARVEGVLWPATAADARRPALFLHSTTPDLKTFEGDLEALATGVRGGDFTTYKEARSVYLARPGDLVVGRTRPWKSAVEVLGATACALPDCDYYYLSQALLVAAVEHLSHPVAEIRDLLDWVRHKVPVVRLYAFEREMQIFLLWLARAAGLERLSVEANSPEVSARWNRKAVLHPTIHEASSVGSAILSWGARDILRHESGLTQLARAMELEVPTVPGYTLEREGKSREELESQLLSAARLLRRRYGLAAGCLKASESGDGARIHPGLDLADEPNLRRLARDAWAYGDDYVLEAHVSYHRVSVAGEDLTTALSAHVRGAAVAPGATLQFMEGSSWKGNVLIDEQSCGLFGIAASHYRHLQRFLEEFHAAFDRRRAGLVLVGIDFAIGSVGGKLGDALLLGVQDLNVSFTGAECLRAFLDRARQAGFGDGVSGPFGVTRIYRPRPATDHRALAEGVASWCPKGVFAEPVASIPGRWGMVGVTGNDPIDALENLRGLRRFLLANDLIEPALED